MAAMLKGYISPPLGTEKKMPGLQFLHPSVQNGPPPRVDELSDLSGLIAQEEDDEAAEREREGDEEEYDMVQREEAADMPPNFPRSVAVCRSYGAISHAAPRKRRRPRSRRYSTHSADLPPFVAHHFSLSSRRGYYSPQDRRSGFVNSPTQGYRGEYERLPTDSDEDDNYEIESSSSSEEEGPPTFENIYRRTCKDKTKLVVIPLFYFLFFVVAGVFAFYSIEALIESYNHRVRTVDYITVPEYDPIGIALFLEDFATYVNCQFKYGDDLAPNNDNVTSLTPISVDNYTCSTSINVTFNSTLIKQERTALIFRGPTRVDIKQSLWLNFSVDTTLREFGAIEFLLLNSWDDLIKMSSEEQQSFLNQEEAKEPLYTAPAAFRSWVKMYMITRNDGGSKTNLSDFYINTEFSKYNDHRPLENRTIDPLVILFEWKSPTYEYISEILSTTVWNTLGSLAGVFVTLIKASEYFYAWIKRLRRERRKKLLKLQEIEEERLRVMDEYEKRKEEKKKQKQLSQSQDKLKMDK